MLHTASMHNADYSLSLRGRLPKGESALQL